MNLLQLKQQFKLFSGRYDLVDENPQVVTDLINQGVRYLDRITHNQKSAGVHFTFLNVDDFHASFPYCRAVKEVWVASTTTRWQLYKKPLQDILTSYLSNNDYINSGAPLYYAPTITRSIPEGADLTVFADYMKYIDVQTNIDYDYNAIVTVPPTDTKLLVDIRGLFYSKELVNDTDENYWSVSHPYVLLYAALRELEIFNQNKTKTELWTIALANSVSEIEKDLVDEEISEIDQMSG
jgi:hypothetical protein